MPRVADALAWIGGIGLGASAAFALSQDSLSSVQSLAGALDAVGRLSGMVGTYLLIVMLMLMSRLPWLERTVGQDRLTSWHRRIGGWPVVLIAVHVSTLLYGYALVARVSVISQAVTFIRHYPDMLSAFVAFALIVVASVVSIPYVRRRLHYETWWTVHLAFYVAVALAFSHQVHTGVIFIGYPLARELWTSAFVITAITLVGSRIVMPLWLNLRHQLRVVSVHETSPGVYAVTMEGRNLERLAVSGGQFFQWRFLSPGLILHSHPYSLSALPRPPYLRVTIKGLGDQSSAVAHLREGTRVFIEGPYGVFTSHQLTTTSATLVAAGVGITPLRALLEDLPEYMAVTVIVRASCADELVHHDEVKDLVAGRGGTLHEVIGPRNKVRLNRTTLSKLAPDIRSGDLYICGPSGFTHEVIHAARALGIAPSRIHCEEFSF